MCANVIDSSMALSFVFEKGVCSIKEDNTAQIKRRIKCAAWSRSFMTVDKNLDYEDWCWFNIMIRILICKSNPYVIRAFSQDSRFIHSTLSKRFNGVGWVPD